MTDVLEWGVIAWSIAAGFVFGAWLGLSMVITIYNKATDKRKEVPLTWDAESNTWTIDRPND